jgi:hypothetical protein
MHTPPAPPQPVSSHQVLPWFWTVLQYSGIAANWPWAIAPTSATAPAVSDRSRNVRPFMVGSFQKNEVSSRIASICLWLVPVKAQ